MPGELNRPAERGRTQVRTNPNQLRAPATSTGMSPISPVDASRPAGRRASTPKVRTGCVTCKNRHVKCDERKPTCQRCEKTGVDCGGYVPKPESKSGNKRAPRSAIHIRGLGNGRPLQVIRPALVPSSFVDEDILYFDFFRHSLVNDLSGFHNGDFWSRVVLCEGMRDDCVQHAILAIGALSQALLRGSTESQDLPSVQATGMSPSPIHPSIRRVLNEHHNAAIHHQNRAISLCLKRTQQQASDPMSSRTVLIITLLLVAYEFLQGDMEAADGLLLSGVRLLQDSIAILRETVSAKQHNNAKIAPLPPRPDEDLEDMGHMLPFLSIRSGHTHNCPSQLRLYPHLISCPDDDLHLPPPRGTSTAKLLYAWGNFHTRGIVFVSQAMMRTYLVTVADENDRRQLVHEQSKFLALLRQWQTVISEYHRDPGGGRSASTPPSSDDPRTRKALWIVQLQYLTSLITLSFCLDPTDTVGDAFEAEFAEILRIVEIFLADPHPVSSNKIKFTFGGGSLAAPLALVACRCRTNRSLRMRAVDAFRRLSWREGAWDGKVLLCCVGLVILEESKRGADGGVPPDWRWLWTGAKWDMDRRQVTGEYTRVTRAEDGGVVKAKLVMDVDHWVPVGRPEIEIQGMLQSPVEGMDAREWLWAGMVS
ncbi:hypothetical protein B0H63DRAFT_132810 [Podospora didyma]|uniref:Zn(2)-C6 fungal-type domain-containing protein n=1 Tax=Podospora didyma TaxID=330526 RepID=A0AAE0U4W4_9PEZI|nr:hypothetical protein B0H63DRAFT_132810 [Podospora didyma]